RMKATSAMIEKAAKVAIPKNSRLTTRASEDGGLAREVSRCRTSKLTDIALPTHLFSKRPGLDAVEKSLDRTRVTGPWPRRPSPSQRRSLARGCSPSDRRAFGRLSDHRLRACAAPPPSAAPAFCKAAA